MKKAWTLFRPFFCLLFRKPPDLLAEFDDPSFEESIDFIQQLIVGLNPKVIGQLDDGFRESWIGNF